MISVITPVFNGSDFIESCLLAVVEQRCAQVEHIIIDGGSTDDTVDVVKKYANQYSHIRWISEKDQGQSDAMNKGIALAEGKIVTFLNVDDYYEPNVLNRVTELFADLEEPALLVGNCKILDDDGQIKYINKPNKLRVTTLLLLLSPFPLNPSAYFYHKSLHQKIGLFDVEDHYMMDLDFILKAVQAANVKYVDETWGNHRQISGTKTVSLMQSGRHEAHFEDLLKKHSQNLSFLQKQWMKVEPGVHQLYVRYPWLYYLEYPFKYPGRVPSKLIQKLRTSEQS
jgi:glycosyltransferase involved in cell wall biosynthesis